MRGRRVAIDVHTRQVVALAALGSSMVTMGVFLGMAVAAWSPWLLLPAAAAAVAGAVVSVAAIPRDPPPPRITLMPMPEVGVWHRLEVDGMRPGDRIVMTNRPTEETT